ncbi:M91 family zinc metallopeptidase [Plantactinospora sp. DSM 117369]
MGEEVRADPVEIARVAQSYLDNSIELASALRAVRADALISPADFGQVSRAGQLNIEGPDDVGVDNSEREAVGLPIDEDDDPNTPGQIDPDHPYSYTENAFRDELGWPKRTSYS